MTIQEAFTKIFDNSFNRIDMDISFTESLSELENIKDSNYSTAFILELMNFFKSEYNQDLLSIFSDYINKCNCAWVSKFSQLCESEEVS